MAKAAAERDIGEESDDDLAMVDDEEDEDFQVEQEHETVAESRASPEPDLLPSQNPLGSDTSQTQLPPKRKRHLEADEDSIGFYEKWQDLLPSLVDPYLSFQNAHHGFALPKGAASVRTVCASDCRLKTCKVQCLFMDCKHALLSTLSAIPLTVFFSCIHDYSLLLWLSECFPGLSPEWPFSSFAHRSSNHFFLWGPRDVSGFV